MLASNSSHCHPADSIFDTNILLSHAICPSLCRYSLETKKIASKIEHVYRLHHRLCSSATPLDWLLSRNLKPRKLILRAFPDFPRKLPAIWYILGYMYIDTYTCNVLWQVGFFRGKNYKTMWHCGRWKQTHDCRLHNWCKSNHRCTVDLLSNMEIWPSPYVAEKDKMAGH